MPAAVWLNGRRVSNLVLGAEPHDLTLAGAGPGFNHVEIEPLVPGAAGPGLHDHRIPLSSDRSTWPRRRRRSSQSAISARFRSALTFCCTAGCTSSKAARRPSLVNSPGCSR